MSTKQQSQTPVQADAIEEDMLEVQEAEQDSVLQAEIDIYKGKYVRALADYQNLEKRARMEKEEIRKYAAEMVLKRILPIMDTFDRTQQHLKDQGLELALKEMHAVFTELGVKKMDVIGKMFDPHEMECIEVIEGDDEKVIEEVAPGYTYIDRVLRVAQVKVGKKM